jgi:hypothetical protein
MEQALKEVLRLISEWKPIPPKLAQKIPPEILEPLLQVAKLPRALDSETTESDGKPEDQSGGRPNDEGSRRSTRPYKKGNKPVDEDAQTPEPTAEGNETLTFPSDEKVLDFVAQRIFNNALKNLGLKPRATTAEITEAVKKLTENFELSRAQLAPALTMVAFFQSRQTPGTAEDKSELFSHLFLELSESLSQPGLSAPSKTSSRLTNLNRAAAFARSKFIRERSLEGLTRETANIASPLNALKDRLEARFSALVDPENLSRVTKLINIKRTDQNRYNRLADQIVAEPDSFADLLDAAEFAPTSGKNYSTKAVKRALDSTQRGRAKVDADLTNVVAQAGTDVDYFGSVRVEVPFELVEKYIVPRLKATLGTLAKSERAGRVLDLLIQNRFSADDNLNAERVRAAHGAKRGQAKLLSNQALANFYGQTYNQKVSHDTVGQLRKIIKDIYEPLEISLRLAIGASLNQQVPERLAQLAMTLNDPRVSAAERAEALRAVGQGRIAYFKRDGTKYVYASETGEFFKLTESGFLANVDKNFDPALADDSKISFDFAESNGVTRQVTFDQEKERFLYKGSNGQTYQYKNPKILERLEERVRDILGRDDIYDLLALAADGGEFVAELARDPEATLENNATPKTPTSLG